MPPNENLEMSMGSERTAPVVPTASDRAEPGVAQRVLDAITARPFVPSAELCEQFGVSKDQLKAIYADARLSATTQAKFARSPFFYLTKTIHRLTSDHARTMQVLRDRRPQNPFETLELFISADCNVNCTFCYRRDRDYGDQRILAASEFLAIIDEFADSKGKNMDVSGGLEPLLSPAVAEVFAKGIERGLRVNLYTIGNALHNPKIQDLLMQLSQIPFSELKIERNFVAGIAGDPVRQAIVRSCAELGAALGLHVVAEGVETRDEMACVQRLGCSHVQGYLASRPLPAQVALQWLRELPQGRLVL